MKSLIYSLALVLLVGGGYLLSIQGKIPLISQGRDFSSSSKLLVKSSQQKRTKLLITPTPTLVPIKSGWKQFKNSKYSFIYPEEAAIENLPNDSVTLTYKKDKQQETRYTLQIESLPAKYNTVENYAIQAQEGARVECRGNFSISTLSETKISNKATKMFTITNCLGLGSSTQYYVDTDKTVTQISILITGITDENEYKEITDTILSSLQL